MKWSLPGKRGKLRRLGLLTLFGVLLVAGLLAWRRELAHRHEPLVLTPSSSEPVKTQAPDFHGKKVLRILAVDGGGVRGMIPIAALAYLEHKTGRPTAELFDLFIGTSSGGVITMGCLVPGSNGQPRFSADDLMASFIRSAPEIFTPSMKHTVLTLDGILAPKYSSTKKDAAFQETLGPCLFGKLMKPAVLTSFNLSTASPELLPNWQPEWTNYAAADLLGAATTFPGVFDPVVLIGADRKPIYLSDVGMVENDPSFAALQMARQLAPGAKVILVNLGTGRFLPDPTSSDLTRWGELHWLSDMLPSISSGNVQVTKRNLEREQAYLGETRIKYFTCDIDIPPGRFYHPFDGSAENIANIRQLAQKSVEINQATLDAVAAAVTEAEPATP